MTGEFTEKLTLKRLLEVLDYDPITGHFTWAIATGRVRTGEMAGCRTPEGYIKISIDGELYRAHRLAWLYMRGHWPAGELDHINNDGTDNCIANLREATRSQNMANARVRKISKSGLKSIYRRGDRWLCFIGHNRKRINLGAFDTAEAAQHAYLAKAKELFGEFARSN